MQVKLLQVLRTHVDLRVVLGHFVRGVVLCFFFFVLLKYVLPNELAHYNVMKRYSEEKGLFLVRT